MVDKLRAQERIEVIRRYRSLLEDYVGISYEEFAGQDRQTELAAGLNYLQTALQATIDLAKHLLATRNVPNPKELKDIFLDLERLKILDEGLAQRLGESVGMRNAIVHSYLDLDYHKIYYAIQNHLGDFDDFVTAIEEFLKKEEDVKID